MPAAATEQDPPSENQPDRLVELCRAGDPAAFEKVYRLHAAAIYGHLRALLYESEVEDALQQTFAQAFKSFRKFEGRSRLSTWLHGIAVRVALNVRRGRRRRSDAMRTYTDESPVRDGPAPSPEGALASRRMLAKLEQHLQGEDEERRAAFIMYYVEEMPLAEVAAVLGGGADAIWAGIKRTRARLVEAVEREQKRAALRTSGGT